MKMNLTKRKFITFLLEYKFVFSNVLIGTLEQTYFELVILWGLGKRCWVPSKLKLTYIFLMCMLVYYLVKKYI